MGPHEREEISMSNYATIPGSNCIDVDTEARKDPWNFDPREAVRESGLRLPTYSPVTWPEVARWRFGRGPIAPLSTNGGAPPPVVPGPLREALTRLFAGNPDYVAAQNPYLSGDAAKHYFRVFNGPGLSDGMAAHLMGVARFAAYPWVGPSGPEECARARCKAKPGEAAKHRCVGHGCRYGVITLKDAAMANAARLDDARLALGLTGLWFGSDQRLRLLVLVDEPRRPSAINAVLTALLGEAEVELDGARLKPPAGPTKDGGTVTLPYHAGIGNKCERLVDLKSMHHVSTDNAVELMRREDAARTPAHVVDALLAKATPTRRRARAPRQAEPTPTAEPSIRTSAACQSTSGGADGESQVYSGESPLGVEVLDVHGNSVPSPPCSGIDEHGELASRQSAATGHADDASLHFVNAAGESCWLPDPTLRDERTRAMAPAVIDLVRRLTVLLLGAPENKLATVGPRVVAERLGVPCDGTLKSALQTVRSAALGWLDGRPSAKGTTYVVNMDLLAALVGRPHGTRDQVLVRSASVPVDLDGRPEEKEGIVRFLKTAPGACVTTPQLPELRRRAGASAAILEVVGSDGLDRATLGVVRGPDGTPLDYGVPVGEVCHFLQPGTLLETIGSGHGTAAVRRIYRRDDHHWRLLREGPARRPLVYLLVRDGNDAATTTPEPGTRRGAARVWTGDLTKGGGGDLIFPLPPPPPLSPTAAAASPAAAGSNTAAVAAASATAALTSMWAVGKPSRPGGSQGPERDDLRR